MLGESEPPEKKEKRKKKKIREPEEEIEEVEESEAGGWARKEVRGEGWRPGLNDGLPLGKPRPPVPPESVGHSRVPAPP